jgi:DNA-binding Xre family transcriptional regulator
MIKIKLAELLKDRGILYTRFSEQTGVSKAVLLRLMRGEVSSITFHALEAICAGLGCTPNDLLEIKRAPRRRGGRG